MIMISRSLFIGIFIIWHLASLIYIDSLGSLRQSLPQNIISWLAIAMLISTVSFTVFYRKNRIVITVPAICFFIALIFLALGLAYSTEIDSDLIFWYWSGITIGVLFYITGLQIKDRWRVQSFCIYCNIVFSAIQAFLTGYQFFTQPDIFYFASDMRSNGLSQQINILSVSVTASCLLAMMTLILPQFALANPKYEKMRAIALGCSIFLFTLALVTLQSVTTWLSFIVAIFIFACLFYKKNQLRVIASYFVMTVAVFIGIYLIKLCPLSINTDVINQFHLKQMLRFSITLFLEQPDDIWDPSLIPKDGYGRTPLPFLSSEQYIVPHSHNEIFLWIMKGSHINLVFMSLLITGGIYIIFQSFIKYKKNGNGYSLAMIIAIFPIVIHNNVEYPFLLSVLHWGIIILFLSFSDSAFSLKEQSLFYINKNLSALFSIMISIIGLSVFIAGMVLFNGDDYIHSNNNIELTNLK
ncbi:O-antigen ligase domain-containing protein [Providencia vermicola]|uniref:O-antigen ligase domain-containing protein n=1 Tax=Providencia vermicola TaxID=333965 RepID=UPI0032DBAFF0